MDWEEFKEGIKIFISVAGVVICLFILLFSLLICGSMLCEIPERGMFNQKFGTNYTAIQWCFAEDTIKEYIHTGENKTLNLNINNE